MGRSTALAFTIFAPVLLAPAPPSSDCTVTSEPLPDEALFFLELFVVEEEFLFEATLPPAEFAPWPFEATPPEPLLCVAEGCVVCFDAGEVCVGSSKLTPRVVTKS